MELTALKWIFLILAGNKDTHKRLNEFDFGHIQPAATELAALERLKYSSISCDHSGAFIFHLIFFILVSYLDIHKSIDEFEFRSDAITDYRVSCP